MPDTVKTYLEFRNSNWYVYWDTDTAPVDYRQELLAWHIDLPDHVLEFAYKPLREKLHGQTFVKEILALSPKISQEDALDLQSAAICFVKGVESKYPL
jgi:hypothetical protein